MMLRNHRLKTKKTKGLAYESLESRELLAADLAALPGPPCRRHTQQRRNRRTAIAPVLWR